MTERTLPSGGVVDDRRTAEERTATKWYAVATDRFIRHVRRRAASPCRPDAVRPGLDTESRSRFLGAVLLAGLASAIFWVLAAVVLLG